MSKYTYPVESRRNGRFIAVAAATLALVGCAAPAPEQVPERQRLERALTDLREITQSQRPIGAPLDVYSAMARALKYNLERRAKDVEAFYAAGDFDLAKYKLLPRMDVGAGYLWRSNEQSSTSRNFPDTASMSMEKSRYVGDARAVWNTLDFGVSYLQMKQAGNEALIAEEASRKVTSRILADTRRAYWRAAAADKISPLLDPIATDANATITRIREARKRGDMTPEEANAYERQMLSTLRDLERRKELLVLSRAELSALVNVDPAVKFSIESTDKMTIPAVPTDIGTMRTMALMYRPELYEHDYKARIAKLQRSVEVLSTVPGFNIGGGYNYDSNKYLVNQDWFDIGGRLSLAISQLISYKARVRQAEVQALLVDTQRKAMTLSVVTQVHLALRAYAARNSEFELATRLLKSDVDRLETARASKEATAAGDAQLVEARAVHAMSLLDYYFTFAELQEGYATVLNSLGVDTVPPRMQNGSLEDLTNALRSFFQTNLDGQLRARMTEACSARDQIVKGQGRAAMTPVGAGKGAAAAAARPGASPAAGAAGVDQGAARSVDTNYTDFAEGCNAVIGAGGH